MLWVSIDGCCGSRVALVRQGKYPLPERINCLPARGSNVGYSQFRKGLSVFYMKVIFRLNLELCNDI